MSLRALVWSLLCILCLLPTALSQPVWSYCYYIVGSANGVSYITSVSGSLTTASSAVTVKGRSAYNVTGLTGTRVYSDSVGRNSSTTISGLAATNSNYSMIDQLVYSSWPSIDANGLLFSFSGSALTPYGPVSGNPVIRLWVDAVNPTYSELIARTRFNEELRQSNGSVTDFDSTGGDFVLLNDGGSSANAGTIANQCSLTYGTSTTYSFCYYAATDPSAASSSTYTVLSSGTLTATGPVTRRGRTAYVVHTATGTRTLTTGITSTSSGSAQSQQIVGVRGIDQDETVGFLYNDNAIYQTAPYVDDEGVVFVLNSNAIYPTKTVATTDVQIYHGDIQQLYDEITPFTPAPAYDYGYITSNLSYLQFSSSVSAATLAAAKCQYNGVAGWLPVTGTWMALSVWLAVLVGAM